MAAVLPTGSTVAYATTITYDALNRPTGVVWDPAPAVTAPTAGPLVTFGHSYDRTNRRIGQTVDDNTWLAYPTGAPSTTSYTANALNQYSAVTGVTPSYSANGNLTGDGTYTYGYDAENRLVSASGAGSTASYAYDGRGWRKSRTINATTTISVTDTDNREVLEYDGSTGAILRWYAYDLGPNGVMNQMNVPSGTRSVLLPDIQGSVIATFSSAGVLAKSAYQPFGGSAAPASPFAYTGQRIEPETGGLYYYRARHYSSVFGGFLQVDPVGYSAGPNLYAYAVNDPLNLVDLLGLVADNPGSGVSGESLFPINNYFGSADLGPAAWLPPAPLESRGVGTPSGPLGLPLAALAPLRATTNDSTDLVQRSMTPITVNSPFGGGSNLQATRPDLGVTGGSAADVVSPPDSQGGAGSIQVADIAADLLILGGGAPRLATTRKGATQFIFPNGLILRFDLYPGQYLRGQGPHINLERPNGPNIHIPLSP